MGGFITGQAARERLSALLAMVDDAYAQMREVSSDEVGTAFRLEMAERLETQERLNRGLMYRMYGELADPPDEAGAAPKLVQRLSARVRLADGPRSRCCERACT